MTDVTAGASGTSTAWHLALFHRNACPRTAAEHHAIDVAPQAGRPRQRNHVAHNR